MRRFVSLFSFEITLVLSVLGCLVAFLNIPKELNVYVEPAGYPLYANHNVMFRYHVYYMVLLLPLFIGLVWWGTRKGFGVSIAEETTDYPVAKEETYHVLGGLLRSLFIGFLFGIGLCLHQKWLPGELFRILIVSFAVPIFLILLSKVIPKKLGGEFLFVLNALLVPFTFLVIQAAYSGSYMQILSTGEVFRNPWFPNWLCWSLIGFSEVAICSALYVAYKKRTSVRKIEVWTFWIIAVPVLIWLLNSYNQPPLNGMEFVHDAESPICANAILQGKFPWRDCQTTPGIFHGFIRGWVGIKLFGNSNWAIAAGSALFFQPLCGTVLYFFLLYLFGPNQIFLLLLFLIFPFADRQLFSYIFLRLCFYPAALGLALATFRTRRPVYCVFAAILQVALAIVTPESSFLLPSFFATLLGSELIQSEKGARWLKRVRLSLLFLIAVLVTFLLFFLFLYQHNALRSFYDYYIGYTRDLRFSRSFPFLEGANYYYFILALSPPVLYVFWTVFLIFKSVKKQMISPEQWLMTMISIGGILYYQKFLNQPDAHVVEPYVAVYPCLAWMLGEAFGYFEKLIKVPVLGSRFSPLGILIGTTSVLLTWPGQFLWAYNPYKYAVSSSKPAEFERVGWTILPAKDRQAILDFQKFFAEYSLPEDSVWDISGSPALFYYLLNKRFATPHIISVEANHISSAARIVEDIEKEKPKFTILYSETCPWSTWSGVPISIRNYHIRIHALQKYKPLLLLDGYLIMQRKDLDIKIRPEILKEYEGRASVKDLYQHGGICDWGYAPNFLRTPPQTIPSLPLVTRTKRDASLHGAVTEIDVPEKVNLGDFPFLEIEFGGARNSKALLTDHMPTDRGTVGRGVTFSVLPRGRSPYRIPVGSCAQWFDFREKKLFLFHDARTEIAKVSLSR